MAGTLRLSNTGTGNGQSTITTAASGDTTYTLPSGGGTFVTTGSTQALTVAFASGTVSAPSITFLGDSNTGIYSPAADTIAFTEGGVEALRIDSSGRVGIGTTPDSRLHIQGLGTASGYTSAGNAGIKVDFGTGNNGVINLVGGGDLGVYRSNSSGAYDVGISFGDNSNRTIRFDTAGSERGRWDASGRLLVGTSTAPNAGDGQYSRLVVQGNTVASSAYFSLSRNQAATSMASGNDLGLLCFTDNAGNSFGRIECYADATPGTNDYPGRLVFSTTADGASSPTERMRISNTGTVLTYSTDDCISARASQGAGTSYFFYRGMQGASSTTAGGTTSFIVYTNGNVQNTNNSYAGISDLRLKENIVDATSQWADIKALQVRKYNFKEETGQQTHTQIGLIAQEVELISPGLVTESPDRDAEGNDLCTTTKSVNYSVLYMKAVKALQEAMERIEQLETEMAAVKAQLL